MAGVGSSLQVGSRTAPPTPTPTPTQVGVDEMSWDDLSKNDMVSGAAAVQQAPARQRGQAGTSLGREAAVGAAATWQRSRQ